MNIPKRFTASLMDKGVVAMKTMYVPQIHLVFEFDGRLDDDRLARALRLCLDAQPILGCKMVAHPIRPYWERFTDGELDEMQLLEITEEPERESAFFGEAMHPLHDPKFRVLLTHGPQGDRMMVKVSHIAADAAGTRQLGYLMAEIYSAIGANPDFQPQPVLVPRGAGKAFAGYSLFQRLALLGKFAKQMKGNLFPSRSYQIKASGKRGLAPEYHIRRFGRELTAQFTALARQKNATINDLLVALLYRAYARMDDWDGKLPLRMVATVDLRRYLPGGEPEPIRNLSSFYFPNIYYQLGDTLEQTLGLVKPLIDYDKKHDIGLPFILANKVIGLGWPFFLIRAYTTFLARRMVKTNNFSLNMTNMGVFDKGRLFFDNLAPCEADEIVPSSKPPFFVTGVSGFDGNITLSWGIYRECAPPERIDRLWEIVLDELAQAGLAVAKD